MQVPRDTTRARHLRAVRLVGATGRRVVGDVLLGGPSAVGLGDGILVWWSVDAVRDPEMPKGLDVCAASTMSA